MARVHKPAQAVAPKETPPVMPEQRSESVGDPLNESGIDFSMKDL